MCTLVNAAFHFHLSSSLTLHIKTTNLANVVTDTTVVSLSLRVLQFIRYKTLWEEALLPAGMQFVHTQCVVLVRWRCVVGHRSMNSLHPAVHQLCCVLDVHSISSSVVQVPADGGLLTLVWVIDNQNWTLGAWHFWYVKDEINNSLTRGEGSGFWSPGRIQVVLSYSPKGSRGWAR